MSSRQRASSPAPMFRTILACTAALGLAHPATARDELGQAHLSAGCGDRFDGPAEGAAGALKVTYHGVSTLMFSDDRNRLLIDGFFTRPNLLQLLLALTSNEDSVQAGLRSDQRPVRAVLVAHAHHDHAMDVAAVADLQRTSLVVGTTAVRRMALDQGVEEDRTCVPGPAPMIFGPFKVWAYQVPHGPTPWPLPQVLDHPLDRNLSRPSWFWHYKDDENLSYLIEHGGRRILVHPSAGQADLGGLAADTAFVGLAGVSRMADEARPYLAGVIGPETRTVVPIHWDRFTTSLGSELRPLPRLVDDVGEGLRRLCDFANTPDRRTVVLMQVNAELDLSRPTATGAGLHSPCPDTRPTPP